MIKKTRITIYILILFIILGSVLYIKNNNKENNENLGDVSLYIETYLAGKNQVTHPNVIKFDEEWNGYKYWMGYTPYPNGNGEEENPCVAVSNDMYSWKTPKGLANPVANNEETGCHELKDSQLIYRDDLDRLEMWYLGRLSKNLGGDGETLLLFRKTSKDGINWSKYEVMREFKYVSPAIIWDGEKYNCWGIGFEGQGTKGVFDYMESVDGVNWSEPVHCKIGNNVDNLDMWHGNVTYNEKLGTYELVYTPLSNQKIYYSTSKNKTEFENSKVIISNDSLWTSLYRPTLLFDNNKYYCLYGVIGENSENYISMSTGINIDDLKGITQDDIGKMSGTPMELQTQEPSFREVLSEYKRLFFRIELLVFIPILYTLAILISKVKNKKYEDILNIIKILSLLISLGYIFLKIDFTSFVSISIGIGMALLQSFIINSCVTYLQYN